MSDTRPLNAIGKDRTGASAILPVVRNRVVVMIDEVQNLGRVGEVERHVALVHGYGVQFWLFRQDLWTLEARYEEAWGRSS